MAKSPTAIVLMLLFATSLGQLSTAARLSRKLAMRGHDLSPPIFREMTPVPTGHTCCSSATSTKSCSLGCPPPHGISATPKIVTEVHTGPDHTCYTHNPNAPPHGVCPPIPSSATPEHTTEVPMLPSEPPCCDHDKSSNTSNCQPCSPGNANVKKGLVTEVHKQSSSPTCMSNARPCPPGGIIPPTPHLAGYATPMP